jgi:simple sugar transport system permease protein
MAGILLGAFKAGGASIQAAGISPDVLNIVQAAIVLFIAAPPLIRAIFRLPQAPAPGVTRGMKSKFLKRTGKK